MLSTGSRLGPYEILATLGAGGMGEVYRSHDTKLGRDVALKTLPDSFARDPDRVARFKREAQVLASLNHPHIGAIYGLEESGATQFLVLELVDGETLADRIAGLRETGQRMPLAEAMAIARQIADALEAAHERGIVHRDLKPANIALTANDDVKVLDFGLAKALDAAVSGVGEVGGVTHSPTLTLNATQAGVILGTAAYMSPEQAKGRAADKRSDVWSFGCVLFEMLTGTRAFEGEDVSDTLATILKGQPEWSRLPSDVPTSIRLLLTRCLERDRKLRIADISVVRYVLGEPLAAAATPAASGTASPRFRWAGAVAAAAAAFIAAAGGWILKPSTAAPARTPTRFTVAVPADLPFDSLSASRHLLALSPNGARLAYVAGGQILQRAMDQLDSLPVRGTNEGPLEPVFSPDSQWIAYFAAGHLKKIPVGGGAPTTLSDMAAPMGMSWTGDRLLYGDLAGIYEVSSTGGTPKLIVTADRKAGEVLHGPQLLPGGESVLFTVGKAGAVVDRWSSAQIAVQSLKTGVRKIVMRGATDARYASSGHLVFGRDGGLYGNRFDLDRIELTGEPAAIIEGVGQSAGGLSGAVQFTLSSAGALAYLPSGGAGALTTLVWRDRQGVDTPTSVSPHMYETPRTSPDGTHVALHASDQDNDIWIYSVKSETLTRLTFDKASDSSPLWTRDGKRIVYTSGRDGAPNLFWKPADGTGQPEPLMAPPSETNGALVANSITPDGKFLVYSVGVPADIMLLPLDGERRPKPLMAQPRFAERGGDVSPDGRWIAYYSNESGAFQIYVRPFPDVNTGRWQVSSDGGTLPVWSRDGTELLYIDGHAHLASVAVERGATFSFGKTTTVLDLSDSVAVYRNFDVTPDPKRFAVVKQQRSRTAPAFVVVENWFEELKQRVPAAR